ncbi:MAG TPA: DoxX family protein [Desulfatiglandales bacterium]|nr:DoxX family protein [Desulfatiglandales bacterium]
MERDKNQTSNWNLFDGRLQLTALFLLRMIIGWHFLYEGLYKIFTPGWTAKGYLLTSDWIFSGIFRAMAQSSGLLTVIDILNMAILTFVGIALILGIYARTASLAGASLVILYYLAHPPFTYMAQFMPNEGNYLIIDKNLVEVFALFVLAVFPANTFPGFDRIRSYFRSRKLYNHVTPQKQNITEEPQPHTAFSISRRELIKNLATLPFLGGFVLAYLHKRGWFSYEEEALKKADSTTGASRVFTFASIEDLKGVLPSGKIGGVNISRLILGGNLIAGGAHARDLIYVSPLLNRYFTDEKIMQTWHIAELCGINTMSAWPSERLLRILKLYRQRGGNIQWLGHCDLDILNQKKAFEKLKICVDNGAIGIYVAGDTCEQYVFGGHVDKLGEAVNFIKGNNLFAGIGCHALEIPIACEKAGLNPDFYMKTLHHDRYWSAAPKDQRNINIRFGDPDFVKGKGTSGHYYDNIWCLDAEGTIAYMKNLPKPWIGYKVLAAGAIEPEDGFKYAFENGADFIHVGMFDFQIVNDVNICTDILSGSTARSRPRPWYG